MIEYTGDNAEEIRKAFNALKPNSVLRVGSQADGVLRIDMIWPDGQVSEGRWMMSLGHKVNTDTGETVDSYGDLVDDASAFNIGIPE